jgi:predicted benzoate:H+ symporter BenE
MATITLSMSTTFPVAMATSAPALGLLGNSN